MSIVNSGHNYRNDVTILMIMLFLEITAALIYYVPVMFSTPMTSGRFEHIFDPTCKYGLFAFLFGSLFTIIKLVDIINTKGRYHIVYEYAYIINGLLIVYMIAVLAQVPCIVLYGIVLFYLPVKIMFTIYYYQ